MACTATCTVTGNGKFELHNAFKEGLISVTVSDTMHLADSKKVLVGYTGGMIH